MRSCTRGGRRCRADACTRACGGSCVQPYPFISLACKKHTFAISERSGGTFGKATDAAGASAPHAPWPTSGRNDTTAIGAAAAGTGSAKRSARSLPRHRRSTPFDATPAPPGSHSHRRRPRRPPLPLSRPSSARRAVPDAPHRPHRPPFRRTSRPSPGRRPDARSTSRAPRATPPRRSRRSTPPSNPASPSSRTPSTSSSTCAPAGRAREATTRTMPKPPTARRRRRRRSSSLQRTRYTPSARTPSSTRWSSSTSSEPR